MLRPRKKFARKKVKEDKLVTTYLKIMDYYEMYQKYILGGVAAIIVIILLVVMVSSNRREAEIKASGELAAARMQLSNMNLDAAADSLEKLVTRYDGTNSAGVGSFYLANTYFLQKKTELAQKYFEEYLSDYASDPMLSSSALAGLAACHEEKKDYKKAAELYEDAVEKYPSVFNAAEKLMNAARCYNLAGNKENAKRIYQKVIDKYANSGLKNDAEIYLAELNA
ncbi:tetratricopeptide repeat protein [candidate division KSB1 bacterium]|nr:tetratricopeptide repeat protein [candidate division KSB1 bacterium]